MHALDTVTLWNPTLLDAALSLKHWLAYSFCQLLFLASCMPLLLLLLQTPLTRESHSSGVSLKDFYGSKALAGFMNPLTLSLDKEGKVRRKTLVLCIFPPFLSTVSVCISHLCRGCDTVWCFSAAKTLQQASCGTV
jgi:hypothetical protein